MAILTKPMLGETVKDLGSIRFPVGATFKADGIRALKVNGEIKSRSMKSIKNYKISKLLAEHLPEGADGEIVVGHTFQDCTSSVMSYIGSESFNESFTFYWFDWVQDSLTEPYIERVKKIPTYLESIRHKLPSQLHIIPLVPITVNSPEELLEFEKLALDNNFEGVIIRTLDSPYKCGRSTLKSGYMLKIKRFEDAEATVIGFSELLRNLNDAIIDERGYTKRSSHKENKIGSGMLGAFELQDKNGIKFEVGTGFTEAQRIDFWNSRNELLGKLVKYKYFPVGVKDKPRHPVFLGFRDKQDT